MNKTRCPPNSASGAASDHSSANASTAPPTPIVQDGAKRRTRPTQSRFGSRCSGVSNAASTATTCPSADNAPRPTTATLTASRNTGKSTNPCVAPRWRPWLGMHTTAGGAGRARERQRRRGREKGEGGSGGQTVRNLPGQASESGRGESVERQDVIIDCFLLMEEYHGHNSGRTSHV